MNSFEEDKLKVQYFGQSGYTVTCLQAIDAILSSGALPERVTIVTHIYNRTSRPLQEEHLFIFWNWKFVPVVVIPSGFASGYPGEGPKGFALAICMVKDSNLPIDFTEINEKEFRLIDEERISEVDDPLLMKIKAKSEPIGSMYYEWVPGEMDELLQRGQIWRACYWRETKTDVLTEAIGDIDTTYPEVGRKLRLAVEKLKSEKIEEWQSIGILVRDAWIELTKGLCQTKQIDTTQISTDAVVDRLKKLKVDERLFNLAKSAFNLYAKHHDRNIAKYIAQACVISTVMSMQALVHKVASPKGDTNPVSVSDIAG